MARLTPEIKALRLAIKALNRVCHENYTTLAHAARYGFQFGINAQRHVNEYREAIEILEKMLEKETKWNTKSILTKKEPTE